MTERLRPLTPLTREELDQLVTFVAEVDRGLVHRPGYAYAMARLSERFEAHPLEAHGLLPDEEDDEEKTETENQIRISTRSPFVTGGASSTVEELNAVSDAIAQKAAQKATGHDVDHEAVSDRISENYTRELARDQKRASALPGTPSHEHIFDRLHGLCRCGESRDET